MSDPSSDEALSKGGKRCQPRKSTATHSGQVSYNKDSEERLEKCPDRSHANVLNNVIHFVCHFR